MDRVIKHRVTTHINILILSLLLIPFAAVMPGTVMGQSVLNVDFEGRDSGDTTFVGDDAQYGVLSTPGSKVWNSVYPNQNAIDLLDQSGATTGVDIVFTSTSVGVFGTVNNNYPPRPDQTLNPKSS